MSLSGRCVWVVGGAGFLGSCLVRMCREIGARPLVIDPACAAPCGVPLCAGEPGMPERALALSPEPPSVVFICAATRGGDAAAYRRTYLAPALCLAASVPDARLIFCSSTAVYQDLAVVSENSPTVVDSEKMHVLLQAEEVVLRAGGVVARLAALYGEGRCELLRRHMCGEPQLPGAPERVLNYVHVQDAAQALIRMAAHPLGGRVYNVCAESFTKAEAAEMLERVTGRGASGAESPPGRRGLRNHRVSAELLRRELGWAPAVHFVDFISDSLSAT